MYIITAQVIVRLLSHRDHFALFRLNCTRPYCPLTGDLLVPVASQTVFHLLGRFCSHCEQRVAGFKWNRAETTPFRRSGLGCFVSASEFYGVFTFVQTPPFFRVMAVSNSGVKAPYV